MPRLSNREYLARRLLIRALYENEPHTQLFLGYLSPNQQMILHRYYATAKEDWSDEELIQYRMERSSSESLSAGKAFAEIYNITINAIMALGIKCDPADLSSITKKIPQLNTQLGKIRQKNRQQNKKTKTKTIIKHAITPIMRSEIDYDKMAVAMRMLAEQIAKDPEMKAEIEKVIARNKAKEAQYIKQKEDSNIYNCYQ